MTNVSMIMPDTYMNMDESELQLSGGDPEWKYQPTFYIGEHIAVSIATRDRIERGTFIDTVHKETLRVTMDETNSNVNGAITEETTRRLSGLSKGLIAGGGTVLLGGAVIGTLAACGVFDND